jgi:hypothetical protein
LKIELKKMIVKNRVKIDFDKINSISIHFRIGDYLSLLDNHNILQPSYYFNAINELSSKININEYTFVIFSEKSDDSYINKYLEIMKLPFKVVKIYDIFPNIDDDEELIKCPTCEEMINSYEPYGMCYSCFMAEQRLYPDDIAMDLRYNSDIDRDSF